MTYKTTYKTSEDTVIGRAFGREIELTEIPIVHEYSRATSNIFINNEKFIIRGIIYKNGGEIQLILYGIDFSTWVSAKSKYTENQMLTEFQFITSNPGVPKIKVKIAKIPQAIGEFVEYDGMVYEVGDFEIMNTGEVKGVSSKYMDKKNYCKSFHESIHFNF